MIAPICFKRQKMPKLSVASYEYKMYTNIRKSNNIFFLITVLGQAIINGEM